MGGRMAVRMVAVMGSVQAGTVLIERVLPVLTAPGRFLLALPGTSRDSLIPAVSLPGGAAALRRCCSWKFSSGHKKSPGSTAVLPGRMAGFRAASCAGSCRFSCSLILFWPLPGSGLLLCLLPSGFVCCLFFSLSLAPGALLDVDEVSELLAPGGVAELSKGLGLDLTDPLPGDAEDLAHLFQGVGLSAV